MYDGCFQYPEHGFYQLQDRIILFLHDASNPNILRLIDGITTTADNIRENSVIEVVLSGNRLFVLFLQRVVAVNNFSRLL